MKASCCATARSKSGRAVNPRPSHWASIGAWSLNASRACVTATWRSAPNSLGELETRSDRISRYLPAGGSTPRGPPRPAPPTRRRLADGVVRWNHKEIGGRLRPADVRQPVFDDAGARVGAARGDQHPQLGRLPTLIGDLDRPVVANLASRNDRRRLSADRLQALDLPGSKRFFGRLICSARPRSARAAWPRQRPRICRTRCGSRGEGETHWRRSTSGARRRIQCVSGPGGRIGEDRDRLGPVAAIQVAQPQDRLLAAHTASPVAIEPRAGVLLDACAVAERLRDRRGGIGRKRRVGDHRAGQRIGRRLNKRLPVQVDSAGLRAPAPAGFAAPLAWAPAGAGMAATMQAPMHIREIADVMAVAPAVPLWSTAERTARHARGRPRPRAHLRARGPGATRLRPVAPGPATRMPPVEPRGG